MLTRNELAAVSVIVRAYATEHGEDVIGAILKTSGGQLLSEEGVVALSRKLEEGAIETHVNARYEYMTREAPTSPATIRSSFDTDLTAKGWHRAWSDVTSEGTFIVYRRERSE